MTLEERFWRKVAIPHDRTGCWLWTGSKVPLGYGQLWTQGTRKEQAHRLSYALAFGPIEDGRCVLHHCDNPPCVNPAHLFLGSKADNSRDMRRKGRSRGGGVVGERNGSAKLTVEQVRLIRTAIAGGHAIRAQAREYGVAQTTIQRIARHINWVEVA